MALSKIVADSIGSNAVVTAITDNTVTSSKLTTTGVVANSYGNSTSIPVVTVDVAGRVTGVTLANTVPNYDTAYANAVAYADAKVANLVNASPAALDTLSELANALGNDASFSTTVLTGIASAYSNAVANAASLYLPLAGGAVSGNVTLTGSRFNISSNTNISNGRTVTAITRTAQGSSYTSAPSVVISAPTTAGGVQATAQARMFIWSMPTTTAGSGYTIGNTLTAVGGTGNAYSFTVTSVDGSGGITGGSTIVNYGDYTVTPTNPVTFTGGSGTGFTSNMTWTVGSTFNITNAGSGYVEQPTVTFSGGGGSGAAAYATVGSTSTVKFIGATGLITANFQTASGNALQLQDGGNASPNALVIKNGSTPQVFPATNNTELSLSSAGNASVRIYTNTLSQTQFLVTHTANAVNSVQVTGAATTGAPVISVQGSDTNIPIELNAKGTSNVTFRSGTSAIFQAIMNTGGDSWLALNRLTGSVSLVGTSVTASNVDITVTPKGSGIVRASGGMFVNGAITVANSTGNTVTISADGVLTVAANVNLDSGTLFVNGANNRVGINNTAPTHALTVTGDVSLGNTFIIAANGSVGIGATDLFSPVVIKSDWRSGYGQLSLQSNTIGGTRGISYHNSGGTRTAYLSQDASSNDLSIGIEVATGKLYLVTNNANRITIDSGGNTGINTSNTSVYGFNVQKTTRLNGLTLGNNDGSNASDDRIGFGWASGTNALIYAKQDVPLVLGTNNAYAMQVRTTSQGGRVDIGDYLQLQSTSATSGGSGPYELFRVGQNGLCTGGIFSVSATRGGFVHTTMWAWSSTHNSSGQGTLTQLSSGNYSNITMYIDVDSGGNAIISADWGGSQACSVSAIKFEGSGIDFSYRNTYWSSPNSGHTRYSRSTLALGLRAYNCHIDGSLSKSSGTFRIDHPLESLSNTHQLVHSFIEGPKADLIYRGKATLVNGSATVNIDSEAGMTEGTFEALCRDVQCFVTNDSDWSQVKGSIQGNILTITCQDNTSSSVINWMVIGERKDKHMLESEYTDSEGRFIIEPLKNTNEGFQGEGEDLT